MKQNVDCSRFQKLDELISAGFPLRTNKKCVISRIFFQDFPGPGIFKKKSRTFQEAWEPCSNEATMSAISYISNISELYWTYENIQ